MQKCKSRSLFFLSFCKYLAGSSQYVSLIDLWMPVDLLLPLFYGLVLALHNSRSWTRVPYCSEEVVMSLSPFCIKMVHLTLCFHWSLSTLCLQFHPLVSSLIPFPSPAKFHPPFLPLPTPSFLCLLLLPWFTFSANFYPFFVKWLSLNLFTVSAWLQKRNYEGEGKAGKIMRATNCEGM